MLTMPVQLGQAVPIVSQPVARPLVPVSSPAASSFLTAPQQSVNASIATIQDTVVTKLQDQNFRNMLIAGAVGFVAGFIVKMIFTSSCEPRYQSIEE